MNSYTTILIDRVMEYVNVLSFKRHSYFSYVDRNIGVPLRMAVFLGELET